MLYTQELRRWINNMNNVFMAMRRNIFTQKANKRLKEIYMTDFLTGIYNRTGCEDVLFSFIEKQKEQGLSTILLFADIDRMKVINDNYGHLEGDLAIRATAGALRESCPDGFLFGRYGGDEFVAVGNYNGSESAEDFCLKVTDSISKLIGRLHVSFPLSVSVGGQIITPDSTGSVKAYIDAADRSMYERKEEAHRRLDARFLADGKNTGK
jgi:diguanylate cyclase (GGDEF)-like protein